LKKKINMSIRYYPDNFFWIFCCCGCLPIIGLIKGLIIFIPISIYSLVGFTGIAIVLLPHDIYYTYRALAKTSIIGINLKIFGMILLPIALLGWPLLVAFSSCMYGMIYGLFGPMFKTFIKDNHIFFGGILDIFSDTRLFIHEFWEFNYHSYFTYLLEIEQEEVDEPFDIYILQIIIGVFLATYGSIVGSIVLSLLWLIKFIPLTYRLYYFLFDFYFDLSLIEIIIYILFFLVALVVIPVIGVSSILLCIGYALFSGIYCAIEGYKYNTLRGIVCLWSMIYDFDSSTNDFIFNKQFTWFPECHDLYKEKKKSKKDKDEKKNEKEKEGANVENKNNAESLA